MWCCSPAVQRPVVYFWPPKNKEIAERSIAIKGHKIVTPHFEPVRNNKASNDLVLKYNLMYRERYAKRHY